MYNLNAKETREIIMFIKGIISEHEKHEYDICHSEICEMVKSCFGLDAEQTLKMLNRCFYYYFI